MSVPELFDSGVNRDASAILARYFTDAAQRLSKIVELPPGHTQASREFRASQAAMKIRQIGRIIAPLKSASSAWAGRNVPMAYRAGLLLGDKQAREAGVRVPGDTFQGSFALIDARTVQQFALDTASDLHKAADSMGDRTASVLRRQAELGLGNEQINQILAGGVIEGKPIATIRELREELRKIHGETVATTTKSGGTINFPVGYYAQMVARTKTREATVHARHRRIQSLGLDLVSIVGRVSKNFCTAFLGQVFSLSGSSSKYPAYSSLPGGGPPFHPNCTKSTRPFVEALASDQQLAAADGVDGADQLLGMNPTQAQRAFSDLQLQGAVKAVYATTEKKLFG